MAQREVSNLLAALPASLTLIVMWRARGEQRRGGPFLAWTAAGVAIVFGLVRFGFHLVFGIVDFEQNSGFIGPEFGRTPMLWVVLFSIMWLVTQREKLLDAQRVLASEAHKALDEGHESLRTRVFDHLHGTVTSELVVARIRLNDAANDVSDPKVRSQLHDIAAHIHRIHELEVRQLAHSMVASGLDVSLEEAIRGLADSCQGLCNVSIDIDPQFADLDASLDTDTRAQLRLTDNRVVEECLSNALRHAHADQIVVRITVSASVKGPVINLEVTSNGDVPAVAPPYGVGLNVIRARAAGHGGTVSTDIRSQHYVVTVVLRPTA